MWPKGCSHKWMREKPLYGVCPPQTPCNITQLVALLLLTRDSQLLPHAIYFTLFHDKLSFGEQ